MCSAHRDTTIQRRRVPKRQCTIARIVTEWTEGITINIRGSFEVAGEVVSKQIALIIENGFHKTTGQSTVVRDLVHRVDEGTGDM
ncbi:hypothetical protein STCU_11825 [Strigomonas culicis]|uniref:Uncharacterized protein n=1 Tax=Strigomonas culicis TaxID=28005 RepID=S9UYU9_9TRYP|nr:hypothetical protein STCU_11825 [Strigomonas culicis]|eukprot:EPY15700.1 hypothetical protein STCU_11825 [Strigomonas culicis]